jgi:hypothetical protein
MKINEQVKNVIEHLYSCYNPMFRYCSLSKSSIFDIIKNKFDIKTAYLFTEPLITFVDKTVKLKNLDDVLTSINYLNIFRFVKLLQTQIVTGKYCSIVPTELFYSALIDKFHYTCIEHLINYNYKFNSFLNAKQFSKQNEVAIMYSWLTMLTSDIEMVKMWKKTLQQIIYNLSDDDENTLWILKFPNTNELSDELLANIANNFGFNISFMNTIVKNGMKSKDFELLYSMSTNIADVVAKILGENIGIYKEVFRTSIKKLEI